MGNNHTPKIRFPEFSGNWKQIKVGDLINTMHGGASISPDDYREEGVPTVPKGAVNSSGIADVSGSKFVSETFYERNIKASVYSGDLVTSLRDLVPTAPNMGRIVRLIGDAKEYLMPQGVYRLLFKDRVDENFMIAFSNSTKFRRIIAKEKNGSTQVHIRNSEYLEVKLEVPNNEEQIKIGKLLKKLDETIALHQQELIALKQTKQGFLQKMFPKEGKTVPEVRFPGFTGEWRERKLGSHAEILTGGTPKTQINEYWEPAEIPWMSSGEINKKRLSSTDNMISTLGFENSSARWVKEKSVLIALAGQGKTRGTVATNEIPLTTNQSIAAIVPTDELHYEFVFQNFESRYSELRLMSSGDGARGGLNKKIISDILIISPTIEEQAKIGDFFKQLDDTIALKQQELDALIETKKAFLQKMFV
ncbi:restriction endonuclease subunit S [Virgibacillus halodenitrificans]|nr:restriction endonuclease subunit S [Virgibacillus halodenitrificans]